MPRPLLNSSKVKENSLFSSKSSTQNRQRFESSNESFLRNKRSAEYMESISKLDNGGAEISNREISNIINTVKSELPDVEMSSLLEGIVAKCYLGDTYEVHTLDFTLSIVTHYKRDERLPANLEKARILAMNSQYQFVEVYSDKCCCVDSMGTVSVVKM
ncbi:hypothetical protein ACXVUH_00175 (plasmid) [Ligilactobacillus salivarius]